MKIQDVSIRRFLSRLSDVDFRFLRIQISMAADARELIKEFGVSKERFCELMQIKETEYDAYLTGGHEYDLKQMALMNAAYCTLSAEKAVKNLEGKYTDVVQR